MINKRKTAAAAVSVAAAIAFCLFLFINSAQNADKSAQISDIFVDALMPIITFFGIECKEITVSFYVRKSAHFLGYFLLDLLVYKVLKGFIGEKRAIFLSPACTFFVSLFDEFLIQGAASGRSPEWRDVFIDLCGALTATLILYVRYIIKRRKSNDKA